MTLKRIELVRLPETDSEELREYKKKVYDKAREVQAEESWCSDGFQAAMNDLDIPLSVDDDGLVRVRLEAGPLVLTFEMDPENLDGRDLDEQLEALVTCANDLSFFAREENSEATISIRVTVEDVTYIGLADERRKTQDSTGVWGKHPATTPWSKIHYFPTWGHEQDYAVSKCGGVSVRTSRSLGADNVHNRCANCSR